VGCHPQPGCTAGLIVSEKGKEGRGPGNNLNLCNEEKRIGRRESSAD